MNKISCLLLVEDKAADAAAVQHKLTLSHLEVEEVVVATSLAEALAVITTRDIDIILLDLDLGDSKSLATLQAVRRVTDKVIVVLSDSDDELLGIQSIRAGADDFLVKSKLTEESLRASIVYSMTRHNIRRTANRMRSKLDRLTQLVGVT